MITFIPKGDNTVPTRIPAFYEETNEYLKAVGLKEVI
jgi:hypothetical protein